MLPTKSPCDYVDPADRRVTYAPSTNEAIMHGAYRLEGRGRQLFLDGRLRDAADSASEFGLTTSMTTGGVKSIELVDALIPVAGAEQFVYLDVSVDRVPLELVVGVDGAWHTAVVPLSHASGGFVSLRDVTHRRYIYHFLPHVKNLGRDWRVTLRTLNPATQAYVNYPLPDDLDPANNVGLTFEIIDFHG